MSRSVSWPELRRTLSSEVELFESGVEEGQRPSSAPSHLRPSWVLSSKAQPSSFHSCRSCPWKRSSTSW